LSAEIKPQALKMYTLYPIKPISHDPDEFLLSYEWGSFDNREWRPCVEHFLAEIAKHGHEAILVSSPPFNLGEDFVEIVYLIDGSRTTFTSDHLLSLIIITPEDPRVLRTVWESVGNKVGWVSYTNSTPLFGRDRSMLTGQSHSMSTFLIRTGCVLALVGVLLLFAADLLPLELWAWMHGMPSDGQYFKVVPAEGYRFIEFTVLGVGLALAAAGWILRWRQNAGT
jgi:hypothetical protein